MKEAWCTAVDGLAESDPTQVTTATRVPAVAMSLSCLSSGQNSKFALDIVYLTSLIVVGEGLCLLACFAVLCLVLLSRVQLCNPRDCSPPGYSVHGDSPGNTGVGSHSLLNGIFLTQESSLGWSQVWSPMPRTRERRGWLPAGACKPVLGRTE